MYGRCGCNEANGSGVLADRCLQDSMEFSGRPMSEVTSRIVSDDELSGRLMVAWLEGGASP